MATDLMIYKKNSLVEASYTLSLAEQRLLLAAIARIRRDKPMKEGETYWVSSEDMARLGSSASAWRDLKAASKRLYSRSIEIRTSSLRFSCRWVWAIVEDLAEHRIGLQFPKELHLCSASSRKPIPITG